MENVKRLWRTVRWLRASQVAGRLWYRLYRPQRRSREALAPRAADFLWSRCKRNPVMTGPATFRLLNVERTLMSPEDWNRPDWPRLWCYNAQYFDDLVADDGAERAGWHKRLVSRWVAENPLGSGTGWEPYPTSLRIVNWVKWSWCGGELCPAARHSLADQARWLRRHLEWHLLGNHLWANAKALVFAGALLEGKEADAWLRKGLGLIARELREQVLDDGGHFERSPMYQAIVLEDLLDLVQLAGHFPDLVSANEQRHWKQTAGRMLAWLTTMSHPDGRISFFNDATFGVAPELEALVGYAAVLGVHIEAGQPPAVMHLAATGYVRGAAGPAVLLADVGEIGPDYLPGHAHADTLSFELSLYGQRLLVNSGISLYDVGAERLRQRGTAAHNTVVIGGLDSSEVWSSFRVGRRAKPQGVECVAVDGALRISGGHDGYTWLGGKPIHARQWDLSETSLAVADRITGPHTDAVARFHLHPDWQVQLEDAASGSIVGPAGRVRVRVSGRGRLAVEVSTWHPGFGLGCANQVLVVHLAGGEGVTHFCWELR